MLFYLLLRRSLQKIALVTEKFDNSLCSTGFYVINSSKINSETLLVLFKNSVIQEILKQNCSGTILTAINKDDFLKIVIPIIDHCYPNQIEKKIQNHFNKKRVQRTFRVGKKAVEIAIEEGEEVAMEYFRRKTGEIMGTKIRKLFLHFITGLGNLKFLRVRIVT